ncbi:MAG: hypothetical protein HF981_01580 [Desulfobacteraceae bacterium]|nr:hypothetical protein [Desulfobacteraceae bacterium]MBC2749052.1 hypothetical protein [Desulfobacteraceae bacterium]
MKQSEQERINEIRLFNIVDMGLTFSAMIRLYQTGSKKTLRHKLIKILHDIRGVHSVNDFRTIHDSFCIWGKKNLFLAERERRGILIKRSGPPSYGQVAKTLDVVLKVVVYYSGWPNESTANVLVKYINAAVDTKMMKLLRSRYPRHFQDWPVTVENVTKQTYTSLQELVKKFIDEEHDGQIMPVQFDDLYWNYLNR